MKQHMQQHKSKILLYKQCDSCGGYSHAPIDSCDWFCPFCDKELKHIPPEYIEEWV